MMCPQCNQEVSDDMMCDCGKCKACCGGSCKMNNEGGDAPEGDSMPEDGSGDASDSSMA